MGYHYSMAGRPRTRAKEVLKAAGIDPSVVFPAAKRSATTESVEPIGDGTHGGVAVGINSTPMRTRTRGGSAQSRQLVANLEADQVRDLTEVLRPSLVARLERVTPQWAAGWLEDVELEHGTVNELFQHLRDEHGGQRYRVTVLDESGGVIYTAKVPIAGPVKRRGRVVTRDEWEGYDETKRAAPVVAPVVTPPSPTQDPIVSMLLERFLGSQDRTLEIVSASIRELQQSQQRSTSELTTALLTLREQGNSGGSIAQQLGQFVETKRSLEKVASMVAPKSKDVAPAADKRGMIERLTESVVTAAMTNEMVKRGALPSPQQEAPAPQRRVVVQRQVTPAPTPAPTTTNGAHEPIGHAVH